MQETYNQMKQKFTKPQLITWMQVWWSHDDYTILLKWLNHIKAIQSQPDWLAEPLPLSLMLVHDFIL